MLRRFSQEQPDDSTRLQLEDIGRTAVNALRDADFRLLSGASAADLGVALESARREPPNLPMISLLSGVAIANRGIAKDLGNDGAAMDFMPVSTGVLTHQFGHETHV